MNKFSIIFIFLYFMINYRLKLFFGLYNIYNKIMNKQIINTSEINKINQFYNKL